MMDMHEKPVHNEEWLGECPYEGYYEEYDEDIDSNEQEDMEDMGWGWPDGYPDELSPVGRLTMTISRNKIMVVDELASELILVANYKLVIEAWLEKSGYKGVLAGEDIILWWYRQEAAEA